MEVVVFLYICTAGGSPPSILAVNSTQALRGPRADRILRPFDIDSALPKHQRLWSRTADRRLLSASLHSNSPTPTPCSPSGTAIPYVPSDGT